MGVGVGVGGAGAGNDDACGQWPVSGWGNGDRGGFQCEAGASGGDACSDVAQAHRPVALLAVVC